MYTCMKTKLLNLYPEFDKVSGVYTRKDGRQHLVLNNSKLPNKAKGKLKTLSYPKSIIEIHLGRNLEKDETVDHIDKNPLNNDILNLQVLSRSEHVKLDVIRRKPVFLVCDYCGKEFEATKAQVTDRNTGRKHTSFCTRSCSGKYGKEIQLGIRQPIKRTEGVNKEYYCNKEL